MLSVTGRPADSAGTPAGLKGASLWLWLLPAASVCLPTLREHSQPTAGPWQPPTRGDGCLRPRASLGRNGQVALTCGRAVPGQSHRDLLCSSSGCAIARQRRGSRSSRHRAARPAIIAASEEPSEEGAAGVFGAELIRAGVNQRNG